MNPLQYYQDQAAAVFQLSRRKRKRSHSAPHIEEWALSPSTFPLDLLAPLTLSGVYISGDTVLPISAVAAAVSLISGPIVTLTLYLYRDEGQGKVTAEDHPAYELVADPR